eukprot:6186013-Pleurochrysis_carterae.AAC.4
MTLKQNSVGLSQAHPTTIAVVSRIRKCRHKARDVRLHLRSVNSVAVDTIHKKVGVRNQSSSITNPYQRCQLTHEHTAKIGCCNARFGGTQQDMFDDSTAR